MTGKAPEVKALDTDAEQFLRAEYGPDGPSRHDTVQRLLATIDAARAEFTACAVAAGITYEADGHAVAPGPVEDVVRAIHATATRVLDLSDQLDATRAQLAEVVSRANESAARAERSMIATHHYVARELADKLAAALARAERADGLLTEASSHVLSDAALELYDRIDAHLSPRPEPEKGGG